MLWGVVLGDSESGRKEGGKLEKLPVSEYEQLLNKSHAGLGWVCWTYKRWKIDEERI